MHLNQPHTVLHLNRTHVTTKNALLSTDKGAFFELSVPQAEREASFGCEAHLRRKKCAFGTIYGTLNFTLCEAQCFTAATPLLHLGIAQTSLNFVYQTNVVFFELSVPCGTISTPSVREAMLRIVKCLLIVGGTLNFTLCEAQHFTAASPLLHLGGAQTSLKH